MSSDPETRGGGTDCVIGQMTSPRCWCYSCRHRHYSHYLTLSVWDPQVGQCRRLSPCRLRRLGPCQSPYAENSWRHANSSQMCELYEAFTHKIGCHGNVSRGIAKLLTESLKKKKTWTFYKPTFGCAQPGGQKIDRLKNPRNKGFGLAPAQTLSAQESHSDA